MTEPATVDPNSLLFDTESAADTLPVCDHYAGIETRMPKSLALQGELGPIFDVTLDCEDGAPVGGEAEHAHLVAEMVMSARNVHGRCGVPLHALVETHGGLREVTAIAAHPRIESLSFGLMDFVSAHRGAIPASAMTADGQFAHPLVVRAKLEIAAPFHGYGKTPSHSVVTEFADAAVVGVAARRAAREFGYTRMWSIHPSQIRPIVAAFAPDVREVDEAVSIIDAAASAGWAPIRRGDVLHDRASYRYWWRIAARARRTGVALPADFERRFFAEPGDST